MLPSETMIWQPEFTDKTLSRKTGAVQRNEHQSKTPKASLMTPEQIEIRELRKKRQRIEIENEILEKATVDSICQCNTPFNYLFRCFELQCLSRSVV